MPGQQTTDLNIKPQWLKDALMEQPQNHKTYVKVADIAKEIGAGESSFIKYVKKVVEPTKRNLGKGGQLSWCVTEEQAKEIIKQRIKDGYIIK